MAVKNITTYLKLKLEAGLEISSPACFYNKKNEHGFFLVEEDRVEYINDLAETIFFETLRDFINKPLSKTELMIVGITKLVEQVDDDFSDEDFFTFLFSFHLNINDTVNKLTKKHSE